jgi:hypothetical protein
VFSDVVRGDIRSPRQALEMFPEESNVMPKHVGITIIINKLNNWSICWFFTHIFTGDFNF